MCQQCTSTYQGKSLDQEGLSPEEGGAGVGGSGESRGPPIAPGAGAEGTA